VSGREKEKAPHSEQRSVVKISSWTEMELHLIKRGRDMMSAKEHDILKGKKILIQDDEPDVLDTLEELLSMCQVVKATSRRRRSST
jgi:hypoxanthine phosphoribosyltransferase